MTCTSCKAADMPHQSSAGGFGWCIGVGVLQAVGAAHRVSSCATRSEASAAFLWAQLRDSASPLSCMLSCTKSTTSAGFSAALISLAQLRKASQPKGDSNEAHLLICGRELSTDCSAGACLHLKRRPFLHTINVLKFPCMSVAMHQHAGHNMSLQQTDGHVCSPQW